MTSSNSSKLFLGSCFAAGLILASGSVHAFEQRLHASACGADSGYADLTYLGNNSATYSLILSCPIPTSTSLSKASLRQVNIHGTDSSDVYDVWVFACVEYWNAAGGQCGSRGQSSYTGVFGVTAPLDGSRFRWSEGDFAYLMVYLPPRTAAGRSSLKGYWMTN